jgi:exopolysaccharide biosynthesis polyprenyl glycosylphosphotransferase
MTSSQRSSLTLTHKVVDLVALISAFIGAALLISPDNWPRLLNAAFELRAADIIFFAALLLGWNIGLSSLWLYRSKRLASWRHELGDAIKASSFCSLMLAALALIGEWEVVTRGVLLSFWLLAAAMMFVMRMVKRAVLRQFRLHGRNLRRMVIVGTGARARQMADLIAEHPELGYQLIGFIDNVNEPDVLGPLDQMAQILSQNVVDEMLIALPIKTFYEEMANIVQVAEDQGVTVRMLSDLFNLRLARAVADQLEDTPIISLYTGPPINWMMSIKRAMDLFGSLVLIILLAPVLAVIALLIKLTSPGPIFFIQERVGYNKRRFRMFKFRTMVPDAEQRQAEVEHLNEVSGPVFKISKDPRVTPIGAFLRKTSLDELPQLFNVVIGDLSLVGPRPMSVRDFERFNEFWFNRRFSVKPGITCIWQVSGRSQTSFDQWIQQDLDYIDNWSLALDLKILCKTIPAVMRGTGAM